MSRREWAGVNENLHRICHDVRFDLEKEESSYKLYRLCENFARRTGDRELEVKLQRRFAGAWADGFLHSPSTSMRKLKNKNIYNILLPQTRYKDFLRSIDERQIDRNFLIKILYILAGVVVGLFFLFIAYVTSVLVVNVLRCIWYSYNSHSKRDVSSWVKKGQRKHDYIVSEALIDDSGVKNYLFRDEKANWEFLLDETIDWFARQKKTDDLIICKLNMDMASNGEKRQTNNATCQTQANSPTSPRTCFLKEIPYCMNKDVIINECYLNSASLACIEITNEDNDEIK
ncbi:uncharacterized protein LOC106669349 isoform X2 [Cimex lectularius]|uniref:Uncharacterized protein n=1 Tax=Cimex lectularius TaxID=79782 RepID=A0A8I6TIK4_CIMLE|nr:uncharacterized protein LOC106669349 isoform X2 [Cimex lectularius]